MTKLLALDTSTTYVRFEQMINAIYKKIDEVKPQIVVTELTSVTRNAKTQRNLTMVLGAVWGKCLLTDAYYHSFRASEWRKLVDSGKKPRKREELKKWSIDKVNSILKTEINNDNISDAVLIGMAYINLFK